MSGISPSLKHIHPEETQVILARRDELLDAHAFSVPSDAGKIAVITEFRDGTGTFEIEGMDREHDQLLNTFASRGKPVVDAFLATRGDITRIIQDETVSDICVVAHGSIGSIFIEPDPGQRGFQNYRVRDVANAATHLKLGNFYMRSCTGIAISKLPWALPMTADPSHIFISPTLMFPDGPPATTPEENLRQLFAPGTVITPDCLDDLVETIKQEDLIGRRLF